MAGVKERLESALRTKECMFLHLEGYLAATSTESGLSSHLLTGSSQDDRRVAPTRAGSIDPPQNRWPTRP
jgi:hypothetical protein